MEVIIAAALLALVATNAPVETKPPQEIKSSSSSIEVTQPVKPKAKPKKKKAAKKVNVDPAKQQPTKELTKKETAKTEPVKKEPAATLSSPEQKSNQSNLLYYILGFLTLGATAAYFYFRKKKSQTADAKIYTSDELKQSLQQDSDKFKYQPPEPKTIIEPKPETITEPKPENIIEPQSQPSSSDQTPADPKPDDEGKKS